MFFVRGPSVFEKGRDISLLHWESIFGTSNWLCSPKNAELPWGGPALPMSAVARVGGGAGAGVGQEVRTRVAGCGPRSEKG